MTTGALYVTMVNMFRSSQAIKSHGIAVSAAISTTVVPYIFSIYCVVPCRFVAHWVSHRFLLLLSQNRSSLFIYVYIEMHMFLHKALNWKQETSLTRLSLNRK